MTDGSTHPFSEARAAGLSPIPVDTATKRPKLRWAPYQEAIADELTCVEWDQRGEDIGIVCGGVSGRLICFDFEAGFITRMRAGEIFVDAHATKLLMVWARGYSEYTPSGGYHVLVRLEGSGSTEGNRKLAMDSDGHVLVETRGEGGYVIVAPSRNGNRGWEQHKGGFDSICYATIAEYDQVVAALSELDETPPRPVIAPTSTETSPILFPGEGWIAGALAQLPTMEQVLTDYGWQPARSADGYGQHWVRPGKDPREGHSASVNHESQRLWVHSSNAGLPVGVSLDVCDVLVCYTYGWSHRPPTLGERTVWLRRFRIAAPLPADGTGPAGLGGGIPIPAQTSLNLPEEFWQSTEVLNAIFIASVERMLSPDAVLGAVLSTYATTVPMSIWVPGPPADAPLNLYCCLVGNSGTGKTASISVAADLVGWRMGTNPHVLLGRSLRSGEGLVNLATIPQPKPKRGEEPIDDTSPRYRNGVQLVFDEAAALGKQAERLGSTTIPYLNQSWSGSDSMVGGAKAGELGEFPANLVRICALMGVQFGAAANLFTGESERTGFPQRLIFFGLNHPELATLDVNQLVSEPAAPLGLPFWPHAHYSAKRWQLTFTEAAERESRLQQRDARSGKVVVSPLDSHTMNLQRRVAGVLALMHGEMGVSDQLWEMSRQILAVSRNVRAQLQESLGDLDRKRAQARIIERVETEDALDNRRIARLARRVATFVAKRGEATLKEIKLGCFASSERHLREEVLDVATLRGWVIHKDGVYVPGDSQPR